MKLAMDALPDWLQPKDQTNADERAVRKKPNSPYVLLFQMLLLAAAATWIIAPGQFERVTRNGISFVVPDSLKAVPRHGIGPGEILSAIAHGMIDSAPIIFVILFTGGAFAVLECAGVIRSTLQRIGKSAASQDLSVTAGICLVFSLLGTTGVVTNSVVAFVPLGLMIARSMKLPPVFGVGLVYLGTYCGFNVSVLNPATTGLSQRLAELPIFSGIELRIVIYLLFLISTFAFLTITMRAYRRSPDSPRFHLTVADPPAAEATNGAAANPATRRHLIALAFAAVSLCGFVLGAIKLHWGEVEMIAMFVLMAIGVGKICGLSSTQIADEFLSGCGKLVHGAFIVGLARAISTVLHDGNILDPVVNALSELLAPLHPAVASVGMFFSAALMHIAISSGSGESAALIPVFTPLGDTMHLTRQVTVQAVLLGEGFMNCVNPTSGVLMAVLATAGIPYGSWVRFILPLIVVWGMICVGALVVGVSINWGPF